MKLYVIVTKDGKVLSISETKVRAEALLEQMKIGQMFKELGIKEEEFKQKMGEIKDFHIVEKVLVDSPEEKDEIKIPI